MKHYMILETKKDKKYTIQYLKKTFFGLSYWKNLNNNTYKKYEDALNEIKKVIKQDDYETSLFGYHYIDAYKIFKSKEIIPQSAHRKGINKSVFVPKK